MTAYIPAVEEGMLHLQAPGGPERADVRVGSDAWFAWLLTAQRFALRSASGTFTARIRYRNGSGYWYAFRRQAGDLQEVYLGRGQDLTPERLHAAAARLNRPSARISPPERARSKGAESEQADIGRPAVPRLLETKLHASRVRASELVRTRAVERLTQLTTCPLTIVSAPAGYGKTTLLARWIADERLQVAWVTLDEGDNDPTRFWSYVAGALDRLESGVFDALQPLLHAPHVQLPEVVAGALVGALSAAADPTILVLDNYHVIRDENVLIHAGLASLLEHLPPTAHVVLASRGDPPLPVARLRAHQRVFELETADLQCTLEEARVYLTERMHLDLSAQDVATLHARTEGWIAGLQLAALTAPNSGDIATWVANFSGSSRYISDYLIREVLDLQPPELQAFMLAVSPLDQMTAPLCDAVTGSGDSQSKLEAMERASLFLVSLDDRREWYRSHQLFASALLNRLQKTHPDAIPAAYARASAWCEAKGLLLPAIDYALAANEPESAARILDTYAEEMVARGYLTLVRARIDCLPAELVSAGPRLAMLHAYATFVTGDYPAFRQRLREASESFARWSWALNPAERRLLRGELLVLHMDVCRRLGTHLQQGDVKGAPLASRVKPGKESPPLGVTMSRHALKALPPGHPFRDLVLGNLAAGHVVDGELREAERLLDDMLRASEARGDMYYTYQAAHLAALVRLLQGRLGDAFALCRRPADELRRYGDPAIGSGVLAMLGALSYERNDLEAAERYLSAELSLRHNLIFVLLIGSPAHAYAQLARGDSAAAHATIERALATQALAESEHLRTSPWLGDYLRAHQARLWLLDGDIQAASAWARSVESRGTLTNLDRRGPPRLIKEWVQIILAQVQIAVGEVRAALSLLEHLRAQAEGDGRHARLLEILVLVLEAVAYEKLADTRAALRALGRAVGLGAPEGFVRTFVDGGPVVRRLLAALLAERRHPTALTRRLEAPLLPYVRTLLVEFGRVERAGGNADSVSSPATSGAHPRTGAPVPELTARELQVMRLIAEGASNHDIADALVIAVATVKRHVNNILTKLGAHSRTHAVAVARDLHLFDSEDRAIYRAQPVAESMAVALPARADSRRQLDC